MPEETPPVAGTPPVPVLEQITQNVLTTLQGIAGLTIVREKRRGNDPADHKGILYEVDTDELPSQVLKKQTWVQPYMLDVFITVADSDNDTVFPGALLNSIVADVQQAVMVDRYRGGLAIDTHNRGWSRWQTVDGTYYGRSILFEVTYRTDELNPYTLG